MTESQESVHFELDFDFQDDDYLQDIEFHLTEAIKMQQQSMTEENPGVLELRLPETPKRDLQQKDPTPPLFHAENLMLRGDSLNIANLAQAQEIPVPQAQNSRFVNSSIVDIDQFIANTENRNTKLKTTQDINLLQSYLATQGEFRGISSIPPNELCIYISGFLFSVRKKDGTEYEPVSLRAFISSFERQLRQSNYGHSIINDPVFQKCREVLKAKTKDLKSQGKGNKPQAADTITDKEVDQLYAAKQLGADNPRSLQNSMWYIFSHQFGMRTGVEMHDLRWGDIEVGCDSDGTKFLIYKQERQTKTRTGLNPRDVRKLKPKAYETPEIPDRCPVALYELYSSKRPEEMKTPDSPFFLSINSYPKKDGQYYKKCAMGINKIYAIMKDMKENAGIAPDKKLTNYSVRKSMVQKLNDAGVPPNQIIQVTGHKNVNSLNNYSSVNEVQQRDISRALNNVKPANESLQLPVPYRAPAPPVPSGSETCSVPQNSNSYPSLQRQPQPVTRSDMLAGFFSKNQINGAIHVHLNTQSNTSCVKNQQFTQSIHSPPTSPTPVRRFKRIRYIDSDSD